MRARQVPVPPVHLAARVGPGPSEDPIEAYLKEGADVRARLERFLPDDWEWAGKRVLDFGCGSARVLRHFLDEAEHAELWGCDIDAASIEWMKAHLSPPLRVVINDYAPPLPFDGGFFDLVYATSVFTHIGDWSAWLLEVHRTLKPGSRLISSFLGEGMWEGLIGEPYPEDEVGMTVRRHWSAEGADVLHSEWWLRAHWGRLFDVETVARPPRTASGAPARTHSYISLSKRDVQLTEEELERFEPGEPRELAGLQTNVRLLRQELADVVAAHEQQPLGATVLQATRRAVLASRIGEPARAARRRLQRSD